MCPDLIVFIPVVNIFGILPLDFVCLTRKERQKVFQEKVHIDFLITAGILEVVTPHRVFLLSHQSLKFLKVFVIDRVLIRSGCARRFVDAYLTEYAPGARERGMTSRIQLCLDPVKGTDRLHKRPIAGEAGPGT